MRVFLGRGQVRIVVMVVGIIIGALLYNISSFRWLYVVDEKYLTFTQARMTQALGNLLAIPSYGEQEDIIFFGGSGAYHAINHNYLNSELLKKDSNIKTHLVSFSSQSLVNTLALMDYLPQRTGATAHVVITWSFWRFDDDFTADLKSYLTFNRTYDSSELFMQNLESGDYDYMFTGSEFGSNWHTFKSEFNLPRNNRLSTWSKYFILDKIQKIQKGRHKFLLEDLSTVPHQNVFSERSLSRLEKRLNTPVAKAKNIKQMKKLAEEAKEKFSLAGNVNREARAHYIKTVLPEIAKIAKSKGYKIWLYQLPTYRAQTGGTPIPDFQKFLEEEIRSVDSYDGKFFYNPEDYMDNSSNLLEQPHMWWDYVHLTNIGAHLFQNHLLGQLNSLSETKGEAR